MPDEYLSEESVPMECLPEDAIQIECLPEDAIIDIDNPNESVPHDSNSDYNLSTPIPNTLDTKIQTLLEMAGASQIAYKLPEEIAAQLYYIIPNNRTDGRILGIWRQVGDRIDVAFQGTIKTQLGDWLSDFKAKPDPHEFFPNEEKYSIHTGFIADFYGYGEFTALKKIISDEKISECRITGHSLGGALAILFAFDCVVNNPTLSDKISVYTFASPRVGDEKFKQRYNQLVKNHLRIEIDGDIVPKVPFGMGYSSVGTPKILPYPYEIASTAMKIELLALSKHPLSAIVSSVVKGGIVLKHHSMNSYIDAIRIWKKVK